jgi:ferrous iron transport protein A
MDNFSSDTLPDPQRWNITFIGGDADFEDAVPAAPEPTRSGTPEGVRLPLSMTVAGDRVWVVQIKGGHQMVRRLTDVGVAQGREITVVSRTDSGSVIVALQGCRIGLGAGMAHRVIVTTLQEEVGTPTTRRETHQRTHQHGRHHQYRHRYQHGTEFRHQQGESTMPATLHLGSLTVGQSGRVVGYEQGSRAYREKLLSMGLTPGTHFTITRQAPMGDPIEIEVRGFKLSLRKGEAEALQVEAIGPEATSES